MKKISYNITCLREGIWAIDDFSMDFIYVVEGTDRAFVIDTGAGVHDLRSVVESLVSKPYEVLITHGHMDHVGGIGQFPRVYIHEDDISCFQNPEHTNPVSQYKRRQICDWAIHAYGLESLPFDPEHLPPVDLKRISFSVFVDHDIFDLGGRTLEVIHMPGHSKGSCCFLDREDRILFCGDNFGRTLILPAGGTDKERVAGWLKGATMVAERKSEFDLICAGHFCPLPLSWMNDMLCLAKGILTDDIHAEIAEVDELLGPLYHYGQVFFTLDPDNIKTRDYFRIKNPRRY